MLMSFPILALFFSVRSREVLVQAEQAIVSSDP
jgi:hypothetical protein